MRRSTDVRYSISLRQAVAAVLALSSASLQMTQIAHAQEAASDDVATLSDVSVTDDPLRAVSNVPSASSFGFTKPLLETPRTVSFVSEEQIRLFGVSTVEDLTRVVPGTYTTTRYGLQGGINVRGVSADTYYRGMKRLNQQGHVRTVLSAMDNIEVVKGPPSPIFGMGKIGGYTNLDPKSSRAKTGKYMTQSSGFLQGTLGSYQKAEVQVGAGVPFSVLGKAAGVYVFGLLENSNTFVRHVKAQQRFVQATTSVDNAIGPFRLETGGQLQNSITSGAYMNRVTQNLIDNGVYISGQPLKNLDLDGDGRIGIVEANVASPVQGFISGTNNYLSQRWAWQRDANNDLRSLDSWTATPGIPIEMLNYLNSPEGLRVANCPAAAIMRNMPAGGPVPLSGRLPVGFVLNPCTVKRQQVDYRGNGAYEREQNAHQKLGYIDLVYDINPDFTVKSQLFYDNISSFKDSWLPYGENQYIKAIEEKITVTRKVPSEWLPGWMSVNSLASVNYRETSSWIRSSGGDFDYRQDIMYNQGATASGTGGHYPNTMFWTQLTNNSYATGAPATSYQGSVYDEKGIGVMFDVNFGAKTNLVMGMRYDKSKAEAWNRTPFVVTAGAAPTEAAYLASATLCRSTTATSAAQARAAGCPGYWNARSVAETEATDSGKSWSASISQQMPWGLRPYFTAATSSLALDTSNNRLATGVVSAGHIGEAYFREVGIKGAFFGGKLQVTTSAYRQSRNDVTQPDDPTEGADVTSTLAEGIELEMKWAPTKNLYIGGYVARQTANYVVMASDTLEVNGRQVGFMDVIDPTTGAVLYPAEAFLYGGRNSVELPEGVPGYEERVGNPEVQASLQGTYSLDNGLGFLISANWFDEVYANRHKTLLLPSATVLNAGVTFDKGHWHLKVNGYNVTDEIYFRPGGDSNGQILSVMPGRRWEASLKLDF